MSPNLVKALCNGCSSGPEGINGHDELFAQVTLGRHSTIEFMCRDCGALWTREYQGDGGFAWCQAKDMAQAPKKQRPE